MKKEGVRVKNKFFAGLKMEWKEMPFFNGDSLSRLDWIVTMLILMALFISCAHSDIKLTGNRSFLMYEHFLDFYKASYEQSGGYWANYLPSTFLAFAIWNLPLYLTGHLPEVILTNSFINIMWYKLLPVILYFVTAQLLYRIGKLMDFGEKKALLCKFAFLVFPIGVFSQFIFSQYDIFTVFFMVWGLYFYLQGKMKRFALMFGIAITFKYHALLYFLALVVLKEKKIRHLLKYAVITALPFLIEVVPNIRDEHFRNHVFGFGALDFVDKSFQPGFFNGINLMAAAVAFVLVWAYQKKVRSEEELFSWGIFFCVAVSFAIFGFSSWNPQWLLLLVPFLVLNIMMNENGNMLVMITNIFMLAMYIFCSQSMVDERVLNSGIFKYVLKERAFAVRMWDLYMYHDENMLCTAMWVVLLVYVVFGHPRYHSKKGTEISRGLIWQIRAAFLFGVFAFVVPMAVCAVGVLQGKVVFFDNSLYNMEMGNIAYLEEREPVVQEIVADGNTLTDVAVRVYVPTAVDESEIHVSLTEKESGTVVYEAKESSSDYTSNTLLHSFIDEDVSVEAGKIYLLEISSEAPTGSGLGLFCVSSDSAKEVLVETGGSQSTASGKLQMKVKGVE